MAKCETEDVLRPKITYLAAENTFRKTPVTNIRAGDSTALAAPSLFVNRAIESMESCTHCIKSGVHHGSISGPVLYIMIYLNNSDNFVKKNCDDGTFQKVNEAGSA